MMYYQKLAYFLYVYLQKFMLSQLWKSGVQNRGVGKSAPPPEALRESQFITSSFWWLQAFCDLWLHHSDLCLHPHVVFLLCVSLKGHLSWIWCPLR